MLVKIDPHVHTRYSNAQADWFLHFFKCPECATSPEELYQICLKRGMTHVTATDHNCLDAVLDLAARYDNVILGEEVTAIFPDGDVHVHVCVLGLDEAMHRDIAQLRHNIYEFARYLAEKRLPHFVAHPLFNHKMGILTLAHLEQMALLFKGWETLSGGRGKRSNALVHEFVASLTPERIAELAGRHALEPLWDEPWVKYEFAGSDDHAGIYPGTNYVELDAPDASPAAVVETLGRGSFDQVGSPGCVASMGVQILGVGYKVVKQRWGDQINKKVFVFLDRILEQHTRTRLTPIEKLIEFAKTAFLPGDEAVFRSLALTLRKQTRSDELFRAGFLSRDLYNEQVIALCSTVWDTLLVSVLRKKFDWHYLVTLGAVVLAPYLVSANAKNSETRLFQEIEDALDLHPQPRVAWFVDGYSHVDGVSRAIRLFMDRFEQAGKPVKLIICDPHPYSSKMIKRFDPIFSTELREYRHIVLHVPPALQVLRYLDEGGFTHVLCSSPGPMGFLGLGLGKLMKLPVCGVHHTDFVRFALEVTRDPALTDLIRMVGSVYYRYMSKVFARSNAYRTDLVQFGVEADRIGVVPSWTDTDRYRPDKRRLGLFGSSAGLTLLSVGRISEEKKPALPRRALCAPRAHAQGPAPRHRRRRPVPRRARARGPGALRRAFHGRAPGRGARRRLRLGRRPGLPRAARDVRQRRARGAGLGPARDRRQHRRPQGDHRAGQDRLRLQPRLPRRVRGSDRAALQRPRPARAHARRLARERPGPLRRRHDHRRLFPVHRQHPRRLARRARHLAPLRRLVRRGSLTEAQNSQRGRGLCELCASARDFLSTLVARHPLCHH